MLNNMDAHDIGRMVYNRIQSLDPDNVSKIMGYLWLQNNADQEILRLALGSDALLQAVILKAKKDLGTVSLEPFHSLAQLHSPYLSNHAPMPLHFISPQYTIAKESPTMGFLDSIYRGTPSHNLDKHSCSNLNGHAAPYQFAQQELLSSSFETSPCNEYQSTDRYGFLSNSLEEIHPDLCSFPTGGKLSAGSFNTRSNCRSGNEVSATPESMFLSFSRKPCLYHARGHCKHGSNCRFVHSNTGSDILSPFSNGQQDANSDGSLSPASLERLELELQGLLRGRRGPISIASLPQLYYEAYGKTLQADGYLTESQRHGKAGYSLTKLLTRLKNTVTIIDRPHGQHAVVLADEAHKFLLYRGDLAELNPGSRQIYLTFPAESTFSEEDVSDYFRGYGPVQDVRIPYQQKRMFGFVTFLYPETVMIILAKGNPHYICGARVLVKPYKEKAKHSERKIPDRSEYSGVTPNLGFDGRTCHSDTRSRIWDGHEFIIDGKYEEEEQMLEFEKQCFTDLRLADMQLQLHDIDAPFLQAAEGDSTQAFNRHFQLEESESTQEDTHQLQPAVTVGYLLDSSDNDRSELETQKKDLNLQSVHNLPDSPFTSPHTHVEAKELPTPEVFSFDTQHFGIPLSASVSFEDDAQYFCRICTGCFVDPIQLNCNHMFCVQCILKVIRVSKDECPICQQHIGSQIVKLLESRGLQVIDIPIARKMGTQSIW